MKRICGKIFRLDVFSSAENHRNRFQRQNTINRGVPIDLAGQTALYYATRRHDSTDSNKTSLLWIAAREGHDQIVHILLKYGACPNQKDQDQTTALYQPCYEGYLKCVYHLICSKAHVKDGDR
ncbi:hypothetical protein I4U23_027366 [Adineta vaga]|nr:hypothetical protein I4U23_027366 [Adineta vaga]